MMGLFVLDKKSFANLFHIGGGLFEGGAYLTSTHILGGAYSRGRLFEGGRLIDDLRYCKFNTVSWLDSHEAIITGM